MYGGERPLPHVPGVRHRFVDAGALTMHVAEAGDDGAPALVLLHGWPQDWLLWRTVMPALADRFHVIAPDLRGFGWSDAPPGGYDKEQLASDVLALLEAIGVRRFALMGHDWGGWTAFLIALRAPERVSQLLALNITSPLGGPPPRRALRFLPRLAYMAVLGFPLVGERLLTKHPGLVRMGIERAMREVGDPAMVGGWVARLGEPARARATSLLYRTFLLHDLPAMIRARRLHRRYAMPVRLLFGREDVVIDPSLLDGVERQGDDVTVERVGGIGHFIVDEAPGLVIERARAFFADV